eukprot:7861155-Pyramimonas_sp.AAC.1
MGWSWALRLCQLVTEEGLARGGPGADALVKDRAASRPLRPERPQDAAGYVDHFMAQGAPKERVAAAGRQVASSLEERGFTVREDTSEAVDHADFARLSLDGRAHAARAST